MPGFRSWDFKAGLLALVSVRPVDAFYVFGLFTYEWSDLSTPETRLQSEETRPAGIAELSVSEPFHCQETGTPT
ncbi:hypothetical protein CgunFtcFv8_009121 [Champsocephalus gunnari]|uniref:Uncharacterized protein n=1 Tax=Champsocephalus gunnari TaxID=52237 RepID=A0AAN8D6T2_CHAGU|nr:hypothetical protein CgunFtcFv8_009121 [Champsocephalus gunnari]